MKKFFILTASIIVLLTGINTAFSVDKIHWKFTKKLRVYIIPNSNSNVMKQAFSEWSRKTNYRIAFYFVTSPNTADIKVVFADTIDEKHDRAIGLTKTSYIGDFFENVTIEIASKSQDGKTLGADTVYTVMLHEIGHAIGLIEHSEDKLSIMFPVEDDRQEISQDDLIRLKKLYGW